VLSDLDGLARELEQRARNVELIGDQLVHAAAIALWTSVAADAFRAQVERRRGDCGDVATLLRSAAAAVRQFGSDAAAERARLGRLERAALHEAGRFVSLVGRV
jgi:hypothetical protein